MQVSGQLHAVAVLRLEEEPLVPIGIWVSHTERDDGKEKSVSLPGIKSPVAQPVA